MLRLETFGGARLTYGDDAPAQQRRRIALFALVASGNRGMTREKVIGYLWPESTIAHARHSLEQLIYGIRRSYGDEILSHGNLLIANPELFTSDAADFTTFVSRREFEAAASLYAGPFLDGFFLPDAPEFERWATIESQRFAESAARVFEALATSALEKRDYNQQVHWLRKRSAIDPLSAHSATLLIRGLAASGDLTGALQHAATYERLVRRELESDPDPSVTALAAELRENPPAMPLPPASTTKPEIRNHTSQTRAQAETADGEGDRGSARSRRYWPAAIAGALALVLIAAGAAYLQSDRIADPSTTAFVAVMPFRVTVRDSSLAYLGEGVMDLLASRFTGEGGPASVDSRAVLSAIRAGSSRESERYASISRITGASEVVEGEIVQIGNTTVAISARLRSIADRNVLATGTVSGNADSVAALVDRLANLLLASRAGEDAPRVATLGAASPRAVASFLQGRSEYRRGHIATARELFLKSLDQDSTFTPAALELALATGKLFQWNTITVDTIRRTRGITMGGVGVTSESMHWQRGLQIALRDSAKLSRRDGILLAALRGGYPQTALPARQIMVNWENATQALPALPDAHFWLGHVLLYQGPAMGLRDARQRSSAAFRRALTLDPEFLPALRGLVEIAAFDRDTTEMKKLAQRYTSIDASSDEATYVRWRTASITGDSATLSLVRTRFDRLDGDVLARIRLIAQLDGGSLADATRANSILFSRAGSAQERQLALHASRQLALNQGKSSEGASIGTLKREVEPNADLQRGYAIRDAIFWDGDESAGSSSAAAFHDALNEMPADSPETRRSAYMRFSAALWRLMRGDTARVASDIVRLRNSQFGRGGRVAVLDALLADRLQRGDADRTLAVLDSLAALGFSSAPHVINLVSAKIHERRGNVTEALAALSRGRWFFPPENLSTYLREEGRLAIATGDSARALSAWKQYLRLRSSPEPGLRSQVDSIRRRVSAIEAFRHAALSKAVTKPKLKLER